MHAKFLSALGLMLLIVAMSPLLMDCFPKPPYGSLALLGLTARDHRPSLHGLVNHRQEKPRSN